MALKELRWRVGCVCVRGEDTQTAGEGAANILRKSIYLAIRVAPLAVVMVFNDVIWYAHSVHDSCSDILYEQEQPMSTYSQPCPGWFARLLVAHYGSLHLTSYTKRGSECVPLRVTSLLYKGLHGFPLLAGSVFPQT
jgi:hypothetical protein